MTAKLEGISDRWTTSMWGFRERDLPEFLQTMCELGIRNICLTIGPALPAGLSLVPDSKETSIVRALVEKFGLRVVELCGAFDLTRPTGLDREVGLALAQLDAAHRLGARIFRVFAGWIREQLATDRTYAQVSEALSTIGKSAAKLGLIVAMENHGGVTRTAEQTKRILDAVDCDAVGLNYDPANFLFHGEDPAEALEVLRDRIVFTHFKGVRRRPDGTSEYCRVREGAIDYVEIFRKLLPDYDGLLGLEYEEPADVIAGTRDDFHALTEAIHNSGRRVD